MICEQHDFNTFRARFYEMGRGGQFSNKGLRALFDFLEEISEEEDIILDVISLCCEYSEMSIYDMKREYELDSVEELAENTIVIYSDDDNVLFMNY